MNEDPKKNPKTPPTKKVTPTGTTNNALIEKLGSEEKKNFSGLKAPIARIEDNVIGPKGNGKYVYYREKTAPGFDPNVDRDFVLDSNFGEYWQLIVTLRYLNFMCEDDEMKEDKSYYYKIEGEIYTQVENFDEDYYDEDYDEDEGEEIQQGPKAPVFSLTMINSPEDNK